MRTELERLLRDTPLTMLAFAIALGWSLYQVGVSVASLINLGLLHTTEGKPPLSLAWGDHIFYFEPLLLSILALFAVLAVVLLVQRRARQS